MTQHPVLTHTYEYAVHIHNTKEQIVGCVALTREHFSLHCFSNYLVAKYAYVMVDELNEAS